MKNIIKPFIFVFLLSWNSFSQQEVLDGYSSEIFNSEQESLNLLASLNQDRLISNDKLNSNKQNTILIEQIGNYNSIYSQTQSSSSNLELLQYGDSNTIDLQVNAPSINGIVIQNGNNNYVLDSIYYSNLDVKLNALQNGNNLSITRLGSIHFQINYNSLKKAVLRL